MRPAKVKICISLLSVLLLFAVVFVFTKIENKISSESPAEPPTPFDSCSVIINGEHRVSLSKSTAEDNIYYLFLPSYVSPENTVLDFNCNSISINGIMMKNGASIASLPYETALKTILYDKNQNITGSCDLLIMRSSDTDTMYITTSLAPLSFIDSDQRNELPGTMEIVRADGKPDYAGQFSSMKGRGNSSWKAAKKSYNITLEQSARILGMSDSKNWCILANHYDDSFIRNKFIYDFADQFGIEYTPKLKFVQVYINNEYRGLYLLSEKIEVADERIEVQDGCLMVMEPESRNADGKSIGTKTEKGQNMVIEYPKGASSAYVNSIASKLAEFEKLIYSDFTLDELSEYIDIDSWVRKYLLEEGFLNTDGFAMSQYFYTRGNIDDSVMFAGPVWDYDLSSGNDALMLKSYFPNAMISNQPQKLENVYTPWMCQMYKNSEFFDKICSLYENEFRPLLVKNLEAVSDFKEKYGGAIAMNNTLWKRKMNAVDAFEDFMHKRIEFLDRAWINKEHMNIVKLDLMYETDYIYLGFFDGEPCKLYAPYHAGYTFYGWYYDKELTDLCEKPFVPDGDITMYVKWTPVPTSPEPELLPQLTDSRIIAAFALIFAALVGCDIYRNRRRKHG